jgi:hypothetical protein
MSGVVGVLELELEWVTDGPEELSQKHRRFSQGLFISLLFHFCLSPQNSRLKGTVMAPHRHFNGFQPPLATHRTGAKRRRLMGSDGEMLDVPHDDADAEEEATFELEAAGPPSPRKKTSKAPPSSPRVQRLEVREQKKASVKCASTLDFTALSVKRPPHTRAPAHDHRSTADDALDPSGV